MLRSRAAIAALAALAVIAGCVPAAPPTASSALGPAFSVELPPTPRPELGLTWAIAHDVERPAEGFEIPSGPAEPPTGPGTAGHPGHFAGQAILTDVAALQSHLVAVGYATLRGESTARSWTSSDGVHWLLGTIDPSIGSFAESVVATSDGRFVAVGRAGPDPAAWTSSDGETWARSMVGRLAVGSRAGEPERMAAVIAGPQGLLAGGSAGPELGDRQARLWRSTDGVMWEALADDPGFGGAEVADIVAQDGGYVALGRLGTGQRAVGSIAWQSADGASWRRIDDPSLEPGLAVRLVAGPGGALVAVGSDLDEREAIAWSSPDGGAWTRAPQEPSRLFFGDKIRMTGATQVDGKLVAIGNYVAGTQYGTATTWLSTDGRQWRRGPDQPDLEQGEPSSIVAWQGRLVMVGSRGAPDDYIPTVWLGPGLP